MHSSYVLFPLASEWGYRCTHKCTNKHKKRHDETSPGFPCSAKYWWKYARTRWGVSVYAHAICWKVCGFRRITESWELCVQLQHVHMCVCVCVCVSACVGDAKSHLCQVMGHAHDQLRFSFMCHVCVIHPRKQDKTKQKKQNKTKQNKTKQNGISFWTSRERVAWLTFMGASLRVNAFAKLHTCIYTQVPHMCWCMTHDFSHTGWSPRAHCLLQEQRLCACFTYFLGIRAHVRVSSQILCDCLCLESMSHCRQAAAHTSTCIDMHSGKRVGKTRVKQVCLFFIYACTGQIPNLVNQTFNSACELSISVPAPGFLSQYWCPDCVTHVC